MQYLGINYILFCALIYSSCTQFENRNVIKSISKNINYEIDISDSLVIEKKWQDSLSNYLQLVSKDKTEKYVLYIEIFDSTKYSRYPRSEFLPSPLCFSNKNEIMEKLLSDKETIKVIEMIETKVSNYLFTSIKLENRYNKLYCQSYHCDKHFRITLESYKYKNINSDNYFIRYNKLFQSLKVEINKNCL